MVKNQMEMDKVSSTTSETDVTATNAAAVVSSDDTVSSTVGKADPDEAARAFALGKRDYAMRDYSAAVVNLAKACELLTTIHGELADELGDVYYFYGRALFANARSESTVLGDKIDKDNEDGGDEDGEGDDEEDGEADEEEEDTPKTESGENGEKAEKVENGENAEKAENGDKAEKVENGEKAEKTENAENKEIIEKGEKSENGEGEKNSEEEEPAEGDDLQLSWEILEMAKVIFQRKADDDKETAIKLSEVYLTLGENGLESESYETAISDIKTCLTIQKTCLKNDSRRIAETFYQLGMAFAMREDCDGAVENFEAAIKQLQKRLANLEVAKNEGKKKIEGEEQDSFYTIENEVDEINAVIKELEEKIADVKDYKIHLKKEIAAKMGLGTDGASTSSAAPAADTEAKPVTNINHLVRKKRKNEDDDQAAATEKKAKTEETC